VDQAPSLILNLFDLLGKALRIRCAFFSSGINDDFDCELDPRRLAFPSLLETLKASSGRGLVSISFA
jgi:hypothetical protein